MIVPWRPESQAERSSRWSRRSSSTRTGDLWLFRGDSVADHAIRTLTNAPVNHVGMAVVLDDLPPLMWHAELGKGLHGRLDRQATTAAYSSTTWRPR